LLFNRYQEVTGRCLELGAKMDTLTNEEGLELRRLLEEQAWLSKTIARQAKGVLEELRERLEYIENWIAEASVQVERSLGDHGIPSDILALEDVMSRATALRDKARNLISEHSSEGDSNARTEITCQGDKSYPQAANIRIDLSTNDEDGDEGTLIFQREIDSAVEEVAASTAGIDYSVVNEQEPVEWQNDCEVTVQNKRMVNIERTEAKSKEKKKKLPVKGSQSKKATGQGEGVIPSKDVSILQPKVTVLQSPEPMTYKLSREVIASLEERLSPELLPKPVSQGNSPVEKNFAPKKLRGKKAKKKKK